MHSKEVQQNFKDKTFFHGVDTPLDLSSLAARGFRDDVVYEDEDGSERFMRDGNLGVGTYLSCDWRTAVFFGNILLEATLKKGTRIIDTSVKPDPKVLDYLRREFGKEVLQARHLHKVLPKNKKLTRSELIELTRYHYTRLWEKSWSASDSWPKKRMRHQDCLWSCVSMLKRYQFHGYGNPQDDNGVLIFNTDLIEIRGVAAEIPVATWWKDFTDVKKITLDSRCIKDIKRRFPSAYNVLFAKDMKNSNENRTEN